MVDAVSIPVGVVRASSGAYDMSQKHDLGVRKRAINQKNNGHPLSRVQKVAKRQMERKMSALDLLDKTGKRPRGYDPDDRAYLRALFTWRNPCDTPEPLSSPSKTTEVTSPPSTGSSSMSKRGTTR